MKRISRKLLSALAALCLLAGLAVPAGVFTAVGAQQETDDPFVTEVDFSTGNAWSFGFYNQWSGGVTNQMREQLSTDGYATYEFSFDYYLATDSAFTLSWVGGYTNTPTGDATLTQGLGSVTFGRRSAHSTNYQIVPRFSTTDTSAKLYVWNIKATLNGVDIFAYNDGASFCTATVTVGRTLSGYTWAAGDPTVREIDFSAGPRWSLGLYNKYSSGATSAMREQLAADGYATYEISFDYYLATDSAFTQTWVGGYVNTFTGDATLAQGFGSVTFGGRSRHSSNYQIAPAFDSTDTTAKLYVWNLKVTLNGTEIQRYSVNPASTATVTQGSALSAYAWAPANAVVQKIDFSTGSRWSFGLYNQYSSGVTSAMREQFATDGYATYKVTFDYYLTTDSAFTYEWIGGYCTNEKGTADLQKGRHLATLTTQSRHASHYQAAPSFSTTDTSAQLYVWNLKVTINGMTVQPYAAIASYCTATVTGENTLSEYSFMELSLGEAWEEPVTVNTAVLYNPQTSSHDDEAQTMRQAILNTLDTLVAAEGCNTYYISYRGNDNNNGLSPQTPWRTAAKLNGTMAFKQGDVILFERGGVYRDVSIQLKAGVNYGAYGTGPKPQLYGSDKNYADESLWEATSTANVWRVRVPETNAPIINSGNYEDVGNIVFDHGEVCASDYKVLSMDKLNSDFDFYYDANTNDVYLYLSTGNPGMLYDDIEICSNEFIMKSAPSAKNNIIENLCLKYTGGHGISYGSTSNITVRGCEIGYIGGSMLKENARYGNGIEFYGTCNTMLVENCWIYQCYDAGYTNQGPDCYQRNITVRNNLMEYSNYNIEVWTTKVIGNGGLVNCTYSDNILRFAGYGFGTNNRTGSNSSMVGNISFYNYIVPCEETVIQNNIFDCSYRYVISIAYPNDADGRGPTITNNTWIQKPFSNTDTKAVVGQTMFDSKVVYECDDLAEMQTSVAVFDLNPTAVILEQ